MNQESQNWHTKKSENFTKIEMICINKWLSSDVGKFEFTQIHKMWKKNYKFDPKTWTQQIEDTYTTMKFLT